MNNSFRVNCLSANVVYPVPLHFRFYNSFKEPMLDLKMFGLMTRHVHFCKEFLAIIGSNSKALVVSIYDVVSKVQNIPEITSAYAISYESEEITP